MLRVCTSSTESALMSVDAYKAAAKITTTSDDSMLQSLLDRATALIEGYIGYPLRRQVYEETIAGYGSNDLIVSRTPLLAIESLSLSTNVIASTGYFIENERAGFIHCDLGWPWSPGMHIDLTLTPIPRTEAKTYTAIYEAGYCINGSTADGWLTTGYPVPSEVEAAMTMTVDFLSKSAGRDPSITSKTIGDLSISYAGRRGFSGQDGVPSIGLPDTAKGYVAHLVRF